MSCDNLFLLYEGERWQLRLHLRDDGTAVTEPYLQGQPAPIGALIFDDSAVLGRVISVTEVDFQRYEISLAATPDISLEEVQSGDTVTINFDDGIDDVEASGAGRALREHDG